MGDAAEDSSEQAESPADDASAFLLAYVRDRDVPCPRCGYNLRRLSSDRCPECGDGLALRVGLVDPQLGPYVAVLVALAAGLGGAVFFGAIGLFYAPRSWWVGRAGVLLITQGVLTAAALAAVVWNRRRLRRAAPRTQWVLAIATAGGVLLLSALVVGFFRDS